MKTSIYNELWNRACNIENETLRSAFNFSSVLSELDTIFYFLKAGLPMYYKGKYIDVHFFNSLCEKDRELLFDINKYYHQN